MDIARRKVRNREQERAWWGITEEVRGKPEWKELQHLNTQQASEERAPETWVLSSCRLALGLCWLFASVQPRAQVWCDWGNTVRLELLLSQAGVRAKVGWLGWLCAAPGALAMAFAAGADPVPEMHLVALA